MADDILSKANLASVPTIGRRLDEQGILLLRKLLKEAENGELLSIGACGERADGAIVASFSWGSGDRKNLCVSADILHNNIRGAIVPTSKKL